MYIHKNIIIYYKNNYRDHRELYRIIIDEKKKKKKKKEVKGEIFYKYILVSTRVACALSNL